MRASHASQLGASGRSLKQGDVVRDPARATWRAKQQADAVEVRAVLGTSCRCEDDVALRSASPGIPPAPSLARRAPRRTASLTRLVPSCSLDLLAVEKVVAEGRFELPTKGL